VTGGPHHPGGRRGAAHPTGALTASDRIGWMCPRCPTTAALGPAVTGSFAVREPDTRGVLTGLEVRICAFRDETVEVAGSIGGGRVETGGVTVGGLCGELISEADR